MERRLKGQGRLSGLPVTRCLLTQKHRLATSTTAGYPQVAARQSLFVSGFLKRVPDLPSWGHGQTQLRVFDGRILATLHSHLFLKTQFRRRKNVL